MKKILKKAVVAATVLSMLCSVVWAYAEGIEPEAERVEISFKVGDENLSVNGNTITVEKPYVTENGTTLVPLRVITEAFGAEVLWEEETEKITVTYPEVTIVFQIGNKVVRVNNHAEEISEAPVISELSTMVPLRFISETFGAVVNYDDETESITVIKESADTESMLVGTTELPRIGDSYYGWVMDNPKNFIMSSRSFDGSYTSFTDDNGNSVDIEIINLTNETSFDEYFSEVKDSLRGYTLVKADKCTDRNGNRYMHFQSKYYGMVIDKRSWVDEKNIIEVSTCFDFKADEQIKNSCLSLADSFCAGGSFDENVYDLTDIEDGYRLFEDETYKVSFEVPADYSRDEYLNSENEFMFMKDGEAKGSYVYLGIYSKSDDVGAKKFAAVDRENNIKYTNKDLVNVTEIMECDINGVTGYKYVYSTQNSCGDNHNFTDTFFELGDYVYNLCTDVYSDQDECITDEIVKSLKAETLDKSEIGTLLRNDPEKTDKNIKSDDWILKLPYSWIQEYDAFDMGVSFTHRFCDSVGSVGISYNKDITDKSDASDFADMAEEYAGISDMEITEEIRAVKINDDTYYKTVMIYEDEKEKVYVTVYMTYKNLRLVSFILTQSELAYNSAADDEFVDIIESFEMK